LGEDAPKRIPIPSAADRKASEKIIEEIYADEVAKLTPETRPALIEHMLAQVADTKDDPAGRYTLISLAAGHAAQGGDLDTFLTLRDKLAAEFIIPEKEFTLFGIATILSAT